MKNLKIHKKIVPLEELSNTSDFFTTALIIIICLLGIPLILIAWLAILLSNAWAAKRHPVKQLTDGWLNIETDAALKIGLSYRSIDAASVSDAAAGYFDTEHLNLYRTVPKLDFFTGYFTSFKIELPDGIFVQKIYFDDTLEEVLSSPLYFFSYQTTEAEEIHDLKDYVLLDTKGSPTDFLLTASGEQHDAEIRITRL